MTTTIDRSSTAGQKRNAGHRRTETPLIDVSNLRVTFGEKEIVKGVSFSVDEGECLAIVGESGSGKSVTARTLIGKTGRGAVVDADRLDFAGRDLLSFSERDWRGIRGLDIGFVLQDALVSLDPMRRVGDEIAEAISVHSSENSIGPRSRRQRRARVLDLLKSVGIPEPEIRARQRPHELSGGLRQRALIACALANDPKLIIADEPTTALDATVQAQILDVLGVAKKRGNGIILISHDLAVVGRLADRIAVMKNGEIVESGLAGDVLQRPHHEYTQSLLDAVPSRASKGTLLTTGESLTPASTIDSTRPLAIKARGLHKKFGGKNSTSKAAVADIDIEIGAGRTLGIVGESGSGKTTVSRIILGLTEPDSGVVSINGKPWSELTERKRRDRRQEITVIYQDPLSSFDPRWDVEKILVDAVGARLGAEHVDERVSELLKQVGLSDEFRRRQPLRLSGGQRQRVAIARALAPRPSVIVCDEPVSALDVSVQARILDLLSTLQAVTGVSMLFISHDLGVIHHVSDDILVMKEGQAVEYGPADQVFERPVHEYTRQLLAAVPRLEGGFAQDGGRTSASSSKT